ncbi:complement C1q tumor necrosis factor-related protein 4 [Tetranychus urticae]|uniref:complement C1q tumor necrosis factor-related protein 4 n=1 Tax=Tetranychus urticae TaxID=32264 RepID=UPI000D64B4AB|nr:complement C1q tumor necrosis factor-related protein 4 [Tetranychus urticae]
MWTCHFKELKPMESLTIFLDYLVKLIKTCFVLTFKIQISTAFDPISFTAIKGSRYDNYISLSTMVVNNRATFNNLYGAFKCTVPGIYFFSFTALGQPNKELRLSLRVSKFPVITVYSNGPASNTVSGSTLLHLSEGDLVYLFIEKGDITESNQLDHAYTSFSGYQLSDKAPTGFLSGIVGRQSMASASDDRTESSESTDVNSKVQFKPDHKDHIFELMEASDDSDD